MLACAETDGPKGKLRLMAEYRCNVFGVLIAICGEPGAWSAFQLGSDGKRRPAGFVVPGFLEREELCQYLADLLHESATPTNNRADELK